MDEKGLASFFDLGNSLGEVMKIVSAKKVMEQKYFLIVEKLKLLPLKMRKSIMRL